MPHEPLTRAQELASSDRAMFLARMVGVVFAAVQVTLTPNQPTWVPPLAFGWAGALFACAILLRAVASMATDRARALATIALLGLAVDTAVVMAFVFLYTYDPLTAMWAILFIIPLEGAIRFGLRGAIGSMTVAAVLYTVRELWGAGAYGYPFLIDSVSYRMGIGFIVALVAGLMARNLTREREHVKAAYEHRLELDRLKDEFLTATSHELRTPLTVISGFAATLRRQLDLPRERRAQYLDAICRHADRLTHLANDIIDITRLQQGRLPLSPEAIVVRDVVGRAVDAAGIDAGIDVPGQLTAFADPARVEQILFNLLHNAEKYGLPPVRVEGASVGDEVELVVSDQGEGVPPGESERIFELFYRSSPAGIGGTGIGLTFARRLAEAQGGTLHFEPNEPRGARFVLRLPGVGAPRPARSPHPV